MASPTIDTFCCVADGHAIGVDERLGFKVQPYTIVCIFSSIVGLLGGFYQILPRPEKTSPYKRMVFTGHRQRKIITWLAFADLCAALGILIRSASWLKNGKSIQGNGGIFCAIASGWIQFFYIATYYWNLCYALDVYLVLKQKKGYMWMYHMMCWGLPVLSCALGLTILYYPELQCSHDVLNVLTNYLCVHIPLIGVMIINPVLYILSSRSVEQLLSQNGGKYSVQERKLATALRYKFFRIVLVYYICWIPNVINSILLWTLWYRLLEVKNIVMTVWYVMAVLNPLQAVLNSLVYRGWYGMRHVKELLVILFCGTDEMEQLTRLKMSETESEVHSPAATQAEVRPLLREPIRPSVPTATRKSVNGD